MCDGITILPSKIIQIDNDLALCEDGSVWAINDARTTPYIWVCVHPPHQPPTQSSDVFEAVDSLLKKYGLEPYRTQKT